MRASAPQSQSFPSLKPLGGYMTDLVERCAFLSAWAERGPPAAFWLGAFFFPPAFTTAALQVRGCCWDASSSYVPGRSVPCRRP